MTLNKIKNLRNKERGFTIVELLIVIVIIGILAAIVIVAYNGVTNRAKTQSANSAASNVQKKIEAYAAANNGSYPTGAANGNAFEALLNGVTESNIGTIQIAVPTASTGQSTVQVEYCSTGGTGVRLGWFDYGANAVVADGSKLVTTFSGTCSAWGKPLA